MKVNMTDIFGKSKTYICKNRDLSNIVPRFERCDDEKG